MRRFPLSVPAPAAALRRSLLGAMGVLLASAPARADEVVATEFSAQKFAPAPGPRNFVTVEGARTDGRGSYSLGLFFNYAADPLVLRTCQNATSCSDPERTRDTRIRVVKSLATADLLGSITVMPRLQLGLRVPVSVVSGDGLDAAAGTVARDGLSGTGLGDPNLEAKARVLGGATDPLVLGVGAFVTAPLGRTTAKDKYLGEGSATGGLRAIADYQPSRVFDLGANVGFVGRGTERLGTAEVGSALRYGVAARLHVSPVLRFVGEVFGDARLGGGRGSQASEGDLSVQIQPLRSGFRFFLGGGLGLTRGAGAPLFRGFGGIMYVKDKIDADGDGIEDEDDLCPSDPEDKDGFQDADGCPDPDNDGDDIPDAADKCPNQPETRNGFEDDDGCPDDLPDRDHDGIADPDDMCPDAGGPTVIRAKGKDYGCPDRDKDGIPDHVDRCPDEPEDTDGFEDDDGCPDPDNDKDGVPDPEDECVDIPGTKANHGCPDPDTDGDGIPDSRDKCPTKPETYNGYQDEDGCPDKAPGSLVELTDDGIKILDRVEFATGSDKITGAKSFKILDQVAAVLKANQSIFLVEIAGHTDDTGGAEANKALSQKRAEAVRSYLVDKRGVPASKLRAMGYGQERPIDDNATPKGRQANRRVEFNIVKSVKKSGDPAAH